MQNDTYLGIKGHVTVLLAGLQASDWVFVCVCLLWVFVCVSLVLGCGSTCSQRQLWESILYLILENNDEPVTAMLALLLRPIAFLWMIWVTQVWWCHALRCQGWFCSHKSRFNAKVCHLWLLDKMNSFTANTALSHFKLGHSFPFTSAKQGNVFTHIWLLQKWFWWNLMVSRGV